jgi:hypothetical protein
MKFKKIINFLDENGGAMLGALVIALTFSFWIYLRIQGRI